MPTITIVGTGFLGALFAEEYAKLAYAYEQSVVFRLIDFDTLEPRNAANQLWTLQRAETGQHKVEVLAKRLLEYTPYVPYVDVHPTKLTRANANELLDESALVIDAVDNIPTRHELWYHSLRARVPVLHLGISQGGTGAVEWTIPRDTGMYCDWSLSPLNTLGQQLQKQKEPDKLPPCELIAFRGLGLNVACAASKAVALWFGFDPTKIVEGMEAVPRTRSTWSVHNTGHQCLGWHEEA